MKKYCSLETELKLQVIKQQPWRRVLKRYSPAPNLLDLIERTLTYDGKKRITAVEALLHPYFDALVNPKNLETVRSVPGLFTFNELVWQQL